MNIQEVKHFIFVESNTTGTGKLFLERALQEGYRIHFLCHDATRYPFLSELLVMPILINTHDKQVLINYLETLPNIAGIFSSSEYYIEMAAQLAQHFAVNSASPQAIAHCRSKDRTCEILTKHGVRAPQSTVIDNLEELDNSLKQFTFPIIIKPCMGSGSVNVKLCRDFETALEHGTKLLSCISNERGLEVKNAILCQSYIDGEEFSVETIGDGKDIHILGITKKSVGALPFFVETGHFFPAVLDQPLAQEIKQTAKNALLALNLLFGPAHVELRIVNHQAYIIEVNPRLAGGMIPQMIRAATDVDIIQMVFDLYVGKKVTLDISAKHYAAIRFLVATSAGKIQSITHSISQHSGIFDFATTKNPGDKIELTGDFRDRCGYVITYGTNPSDVIQSADAAIEIMSIVMEPDSRDDNQLSQFNKRLHPQAQAIIDKAPLAWLTNRQELEFYAEIDQAHLIMLYECNIISKETLSALLKVILELQNDHFSAVLNQAPPRGWYLAYENYLINQLGLTIGGTIHTARSRNDINATIFLLQMRKLFFLVLKKLWRLRFTLIIKAHQSLAIPLPIYSQYQPALPGTLAHYLLAIDQGLKRDMKELINLYDFLNISPLGAGAGGGTSFPINPTITANLLGFEFTASNSLDAVAARDSALRFLAQLSVNAVTLSRVTEDLQLWSTQEYHLISFSDTLLGGSSMMPQKKNPYLLEKIKGRLAGISSYFAAAVNTMHKVPYNNSVEVGTESIRHLMPAINDWDMAIELLSLNIDDFKVDETRAINLIKENLTYATYLTDTLVQKDGIPFRQAHQLITDKIHSASATQHSAEDLLFTSSPNLKQLSRDPCHWIETIQFGFGPGADSVQQQIFNTIMELNDISQWIGDKEFNYARAVAKRSEWVDELLASENVSTITS